MDNSHSLHSYKNVTYYDGSNEEELVHEIDSRRSEVYKITGTVDSGYENPKASGGE